MSFRSNYAVVGAALGGKAGEIISATLQAPSIIYFNIVAVIFLTIYSRDSERKVSLLSIVHSILTNPLILAQFAAISCLSIRGLFPHNASGIPIFTIANNLPWLYKAILSLTGISSPLALILLGAQINFSSIKNLKKLLLVSNILKLIIAPLVGFTLLYLISKENYLAITSATVSALLALYGSPSPSVAAVMAEEMDCDGELARQCVIWSTVLSMLTLMLWTIFFRMINWL